MSDGIYLASQGHLGRELTHEPTVSDADRRGWRLELEGLRCRIFESHSRLLKDF